VAIEHRESVLSKIKNKKTKLETKGIINKIIAICPAKPIAKYTGKDTGDFLQYIDNMPTGLEVGGIEGRSFDNMTKLRESIKGKRLSERQQKKFFTQYLNIIKYAANNDYILTSEQILKEHVVSPTDDLKEEVVDFSNVDLNRIFSGRCYTAYEKLIPRIRDYMHWLPLLGFFTGARLEELCQLYLTDVRTE
jgi:hypothetical protein